MRVFKGHTAAINAIQVSLLTYLIGDIDADFKFSHIIYKILFDLRNFETRLQNNYCF